MLRIAHRGIHGAGRVENSRSAVVEALDRGVDGLEVDLRLLGDRSFVLHHDFRLPRGSSSDGHRDLRSLTRNEFRRRVDWDVLGLEELLSLPWKQHQLLILEVKERRSPLDCARLLRKKVGNECAATVIVSSRSPELIDQLTRMDRGPLGAVVSTGGDWPWGMLDRPGLQWHLRNVLLEEEIWRGRVRSTERTVIVWTVNDPAEVEGLARLGVDGIMTDEPSLLEVES